MMMCLIVRRPLAWGSAVEAIIGHYRAQHGGVVPGHLAFMGYSAGQGHHSEGYSQLSKQLSCLLEMTYGHVTAADM